MRSNYFNLSPLGRALTYFAFKENKGEKEVTYSSFENRFGKIKTETGLKEILSQNPPLLVKDKGIYRISPELVVTLNRLRVFI